MDYKAETTLNEKDSLTDVLIAEKALVKLYATAITEGCSDGFRKTIKKCLEEQLDDQIFAFFFLTENDYLRVKTAPEEDVIKVKTAFEKAKGELA